MMVITIIIICFCCTEIAAAVMTVGESLRVTFFLNRNIQQDITFVVREALGEKLVERVFVLPSAIQCDRSVFYYLDSKDHQTLLQKRLKMTDCPDMKGH